MEKKKKWASPQALIVISIILLMFTYIGLDMIKTKPSIKSDLVSIKKEYVELSGYLDNKIPEIDSTLRLQANQISEQSKSINVLNERVSDLSPTE